MEEIIKERTLEIKKQNKQLQSLSTTDALTGLKSRRFLDERIKEDIAILKRQENVVRKGEMGNKPELAKVLAVYMLDADFFKKVNDRYGHSVGDKILKEIAQRLENILRNSDLIY